MHWYLKIILFYSILNLCSCINKSDRNNPSSNTFLNLNDTVHYAGMQTCKSCHADIYSTFIQTGMGKSFGRATTLKSDAFFNEHSVVYDSISDYYYQPRFLNDSLFIKEFRLSGNDTVYSRTEHVSYIIGSGNHTNSHLVSFNGFVYQAPVTFYTQTQKWDLAPGFEHGFNSRFSRIIAFECMSCHNGLPEFVSGSENYYQSIPEGIDCERCHGAGSLHVKEKLAGKIINTSEQADYTIVNPKRLSKNLQMSLCQRCHLQGISVLNEGKQFDHFKPGMNLSDVFNVFLPEFESRENNFLMASQAERLRLSKCYINSELTCITCHNPHISVKQTPIDNFNNKCLSCHEGTIVKNEKELQKACSFPLENRKDNNCSGCHMPKSGSIDIPHVSITDHYIRKENLKVNSQLPLDEIEKIQAFVQLKCYTTDTPDALMKANAFLAFYEKFSHKRVYLDSVIFYLNKVADKKKAYNSFVHYYYLKNDFNTIIQFVQRNKQTATKDSWTLYRIGEAYYSVSQFTQATQWFQLAHNASPYNIDFINKLGASYMQAGNLREAKKMFTKAISLQPKSKEPLCNLGYIYMLENDFSNAERFLNKATTLDPDYLQALLNKAVLFIQMKNRKDAINLINQILTKYPDNNTAIKIKQQLMNS